MSWIKLDDQKVSSGILGSRMLSPDMIDNINSNIIVPNRLTIQSMISELYSTKKVPSVIGDGFFILEAYISLNTLSSTEIEDVFSCLEPELEIPIQSQWESLGTGATKYYHNVRILATLLTKPEVLDSPKLMDLVTLLSFHIHPKLPWTCEINARILENVIDDSETLQNACQSGMSEYISTKVKPNLLVLPNIKKQTLHGGPNIKKQTLHGGLQPRLGYGGAKKEILEEDARRNWKGTPKVKVISMMWFLIYMAKKIDWFDNYWTIVASFILNLGDDHDPLIKYQACILLKFLMEKLAVRDDSVHRFNRSGLLDLFIEFCKKCLSHIPNITPEKHSLILLNEAYPCIIELLMLVSQKEGNKLAFIDLINSNILSAVTHMLSGTESPFKVIRFLIQQLSVIISIHLKEEILISISRINFTLNQLITNPYTLDSDQGLGLIHECLICQYSILNVFVELNDTSSCSLVAAYKYDYLGSWLVLIKRLARLDEKQAARLGPQIIANFEALKHLTSICDEQEEYQGIIEEVMSQHPELSEMLK